MLCLFVGKENILNTIKKTVFLCALMLLPACATDVTNKNINVDPYEKFNRKVFAFNNGLYENVMFPIARGYRAITTPNIRARISDVTSNMDEPVTAVNYFLQLKPKESLISVARFFINSTLGLAGMFDVASGWGLNLEQTTTNATMASWCVPSGPYLVVPVIGPRSPRDLTGDTINFFADPVYWGTKNDANWHDKISYSYTAVKYTNKVSTYMDIYNDFKKSSVDFYATMRSAYIQSQNKLKCRFANDEEAQINAYDFDFEDDEE